jgi:hypothetical protein
MLHSTHVSDVEKPNGFPAPLSPPPTPLQAQNRAGETLESAKNTISENTQAAQHRAGERHVKLLEPTMRHWTEGQHVTHTACRAAQHRAGEAGGHAQPDLLCCWPTLEVT